MANAVDAVELGDGEIASRIRKMDWSRSSLGPPQTWPPALRTLVSVMLNSKFPMFTAWGPQLGFIYNDAYAEVLGQKHPAALGRPFQEIWAEIWPDISPIIDKAMAGEPSYFEDLPLTMQRKGYVEQTWFTFSYSPVYDEHGQVGGMYCTCTETTKQVLAEQQRVDEIERLRGFFQQAPGIIAVLRSADHVFELANGAYYQLVGQRDLIGQPVSQALPEVAGQGFVELLDQVFSSGEPYRGHSMPLRLERQSDGELEQRYVDFVYQPMRDAAGRVTGIFVQGSDVTEAVLATRALRESEQRLRQLANTIPHLAWMANADGYIHWFNDRFFEYTGTSLAEVEGWQWLKILHPEGSGTTEEDFKALIATGEPFEMTGPLRAANGEYRTFFTKAAPLHDSAGRIVQWFGTNTDIHEIEKVQDELRAANRRKDEFLAMLAHELRNPLAPISTAAELLKLENLDAARVRATSEIISRQVSHMTDLVDDLLDVSRVTRGLVSLQKQPVDLNSVLRDAGEQVRHLAKAKQQNLRIELADGSIAINGDRTRLTQIFANILNNATRYTKAGGTIRLMVESQAQRVQVRIEDNGIGISADLLPYVFDLFTQAERSPDRSLGGLGLGLALVKSLVELHGGTVAASSRGVDQGSTFTVTLPRLSRGAELPAERRPRQHPERDSGRASVMIVDDNVDAAQSLCMLLESHGFAAFARFAAVDAISSAALRRPQIIILDIGLPDMDGYELARRLKARPETADALFIALTGYGQSRDREESKAAGFSHHLVKPVNIQSLLALLQNADD